jgi:broad specificity phosphatase PhoE
MKTTIMNLRKLLHSCVLITLFFLGAGESSAQLKIYYIRHAEGGHNVLRNWQTYSNIPEDQWPAYVGNPNIFTPMGQGQLDRVPRKLKRYDFDFIASSPIWRARNTILPYMKEVGAKGEVWPELCEYYQSSLIVSPDLPTPTVKILGQGEAIVLPPEEIPYFSLRDDGQNHIKLPPFPRDHSDKVNETAASRVVIQKVLDLIQERFGGTDKVILLAGHGSSGKGILRMLTNEPLTDLPSITNTGIWMVEEQANGEFELKMYNDVPIRN